MLPLLAEIQSGPEPRDGRRVARRPLRLEVETVSPNASANALIHNLSRTGLLIETTASLEVGDALEVNLPEAGPTPAKVIWSRGEFSGCEFAAPVSNGAVSAAMLRARALWSDLDREPLAYDQQKPNRQALVASFLVSVVVALALTVALLSVPFAA